MISLRYPPDVPPELPSLHIVLVHPEIHWNTGNIGRTCLAAGAQLHLVEPLGFSLDAKEVRRSGLDYWPRVKPRVWPEWAGLEAALPGLGTPYFFSSEGGRVLWEASFTAPTVLIFGQESVGLPAEIRERYRDRLLKIPMADPGLRSINLGTCVGIVAFEALRQMRKG